jgi:transposase
MWTVEKLSKREIARRLGISRNTVKRYCEGERVPWERSEPERRPRVITEEVIEFVRRCLEEDKTAPRKQRHTSHRIFRRLQEELGYRGAESTIRRLVGQLRPSLRNVYIPLWFEPGEAAQVDWGEVIICLNGEKVKAYLFCMRLCHSAMPFVMAFPSQRREAFIEGHISAFEFFGGVPRRLIYDNLRTAVKEGWGKGVREEQKDFLALKAHYAFSADFCNPGAAHEKGLVENLVGWVRRNFLTPVPKVESWEELNSILMSAY